MGYPNPHVHLTTQSLSSYQTSQPPTGVISNFVSSCDRRLFVSDNPETVHSSHFLSGKNAIILNEYPDKLGANGTAKYRVFIWHVNAHTKPLHLAVALENRSGATMTIDTNDIRREQRHTAVGGNYIGAGADLAEACLAGTMDQHAPQEQTISNGLVGVVTYGLLTPNTATAFWAAICEFTIKGNANGAFTLRTVAADTGDHTASMTAIKGAKTGSSIPVADGDGTSNSRGAWASCELHAQTTPYYVSSGQALRYNISDGSYNPFGSGNPTKTLMANKGQFGATYKSIYLPIVNDTIYTKEVIAYLEPRGGYQYAGACRCTISTSGDVVPYNPIYNGAVYGIPAIHHNNNEIAHLFTLLMGSYSQAHVNLDLMHAGASSLPVSIYIKTS